MSLHLLKNISYKQCSSAQYCIVRFTGNLALCGEEQLPLASTAELGVDLSGAEWRTANSAAASDVEQRLNELLLESQNDGVLLSIRLQYKQTGKGHVSNPPQTVYAFLPFLRDD